MANPVCPGGAQPVPPAVIAKIQIFGKNFSFHKINITFIFQGKKSVRRKYLLGDGRLKREQQPFHFHMAPKQLESDYYCI